jgi:crossover junction endodeoxyribonuclease RuvC
MAKRIMGIDPGLTRCGIGVISVASARDISLLEVGAILTSSELPLEHRLVLLESEIEIWIERHKPDVVAVERIFAQHNLRTVMGTAQASGIALLIAARRGIASIASRAESFTADTFLTCTLLLSEFLERFPLT